MDKYDRLAIVMDTPIDVSIVGYRPAEDHEQADLKSGFPCSGRWFMDFVDTVVSSPTSIEYAKNVADAMWGTVYFDNGDILCDDLLEWTEFTNENDHIWWSRRNEEQYEQKCVEADTTPQDSFNEDTNN